jgi:hypothetical protein
MNRSINLRRPLFQAYDITFDRVVKAGFIFWLPSTAFLIDPSAEKQKR